MTFEEFFKKKKISLDLLQAADHALFAEFKTHFEHMGDKSFDHTKKYWFNKLRHQYPLPPEPKVEKVRFENQISEQTITETLAEEATPAVKPGFQPRFKKPMPEKSLDEVTEINKHAAQTSPEVAPEAADAKADTQPIEPTPEPVKPAFKPRFKPGVTKTATPADAPAPEVTSEDPQPAPATPDHTDAVSTESLASTAENAAVANTPKPAFKPRFKPGITKLATPPLPTTEPTPVDAPAADTTDPAPNPDASVSETPVTADAPKPAYKPRFTPKMVKPKPSEGEE